MQTIEIRVKSTMPSQPGRAVLEISNSSNDREDLVELFPGDVLYLHLESSLELWGEPKVGKPEHKVKEITWKIQSTT